jgi:hypothetical protein
MSLLEPKFTTHYYSDYEDDIRVHAVVQIQSMFRRYKAMRRVAVLRIERRSSAPHDPNYVLVRSLRNDVVLMRYGTMDSDEENKKAKDNCLIQDAWKLETTLDIHHNLS